jgi:hypothetical protein
MVAALSLNRLDEYCGYTVRIKLENGFNLYTRTCLFGGDGSDRRVVEREVDVRAGNPRPIELWEIFGLCRIRIGDRQCVAGPTVEGVPKVENLVRSTFHTASTILLSFPIERRFHGVLDR